MVKVVIKIILKDLMGSSIYACFASGWGRTPLIRNDK